MQLRFGTGALAYIFPVNAVALGGTTQLVRNAGGQPIKQKRTLHAEGYLMLPIGFIGDAQLGLVLLENALRTALSAWGLDLTFFTDAGAPTPLTMLSATSLTGVAITRGPDFKTTKNAEYANVRTWEFEAEATYPMANTSRILESFSETLSFSGGMPIYKFRSARNGPAQKQLLTPLDTFRATQKGKIVGFAGYPTWALPQPMWPYAIMHGGEPTSETPTRLGNGYEGFPLTYSWTFEDTNPLVGVPNIWIN